MGGFGSGRWGWYRKKTTVEECAVINIDQLIRAGLLKHSAGRIEWTSPNGKMNQLGYLLKPTDVPTCLYLYLSYSYGQGEARSQPVTLLSKPMRFGGRGWFFFCPMWCNRWVRCIYLPGQGKEFGCRSCHGLTYESAQSHDSRCDVFRRNPEALRAAVEGGSLLAMGFFLAQQRRWERKWSALRGVTITGIP